MTGEDELRRICIDATQQARRYVALWEAQIPAADKQGWGGVDVALLYGVKKVRRLMVEIPSLVQAAAMHALISPRSVDGPKAR